MDTPRPRFTTRRMLSAALWLAACAGTWAFAMPAHRWPEPLSFFFAYLAIGGPVVAIGACFGRTWFGLVGGLIALVVFLHVVLPMMH
jgi:hypothetical protein